MTIKSTITNIEYDPKDVVWYGNLTQAATYIENGAQIVDADAQSGRLAIAFWFEDHKKFKPLWDTYKLKNK